LNIALTGLKDGKEISQILAEKIFATFNTDRVEVVVYQSPDRKKENINGGWGWDAGRNRPGFNNTDIYYAGW
jgi:hypothetical protein